MSEDEETEQDEDQDVYQILARDYPPEIVAPYGFVLPIPEVDFNEDWHTELKEKGYKLYPSSLRGHMVMLVKDPHNQSALTNNYTHQESEVPVTALNGTQRGRRKKPKSESSETVKESEITVSPLEMIAKTRKRWTTEEDNIIHSMLQEGHQHKDIADKLGRSLNSVMNHIQVMRGQRKKGKWLDVEKSDLSMPKSDLPAQNDDIIKEFLAAVIDLYPKYPCATKLLISEISKALGEVR